MGRGQTAIFARSEAPSKVRDHFSDVMGNRRGSARGDAPEPALPPRLVNGTSYGSHTSQKIIDILEFARAKGTRLRIHPGDPKTGRDWGDVYDVTGTIGRSGGTIKVPLIIPRANSMGGGAISTDSIVRIRYANRREGGDLYRHPKYTPPPKKDYADWDKHFA